jgi:hypothetical protein
MVFDIDETAAGENGHGAYLSGITQFLIKALPRCFVCTLGDAKTVLSGVSLSGLIGNALESCGRYSE